MKKVLMMGALMVLIGCAGPLHYSQPISYQVSAQQSVTRGGLVPAPIDNPLQVEQEVLMFWGSEPVNLVPDPRTGGWMYSRPAYMRPFHIGPANSENNWHNYIFVMLPRNSRFVVASRAINFWGKGWPEFAPLNTGSDPGAIEFTAVVPSRSVVRAGAWPVVLRSKPPQPFGQGPLRIGYTIDLRGVGHGAAAIITNQIYGR